MPRSRVSDIVANLGVSRADWDRRRALLDFDASDHETLRIIRKCLTAGSARTAPQVWHAVVDYLESSGPPSRHGHYCRSRVVDGIRLQQMGIKPKQFLASCCHQLCSVLPLICRPSRTGNHVPLDPLSSLLKCTFLSVGLTLEAYRESLRVRYLEAVEPRRRGRPSHRPGPPQRYVMLSSGPLPSADTDYRDRIASSQLRTHLAELDDVYRLTEERVEQSKTMFGVQSQDVQWLPAIRDMFAGDWPEVFKSINAHLGRFGEIEHAVDPQLLEYHLEMMMDDSYGLASCKFTAAYGLLQQELGWQLDWYIAALGKLIRKLLSQGFADTNTDIGTLWSVVRSLSKVVFLHIGIICEAGCRGMIRDLSELDLWASSTVASTPWIWLKVTRDSRIISVDQTVADLLGARRDELHGKLLEEILPIRGLGQMVLQALSSGRPQSNIFFEVLVGGTARRIRAAFAKSATRPEDTCQILLQECSKVAPPRVSSRLRSLGAELGWERDEERIASLVVVEAREAERSRIARELHDGIQPSLAALSAHLVALESRPGVASTVNPGELRQLANYVMQELHQIIRGLEPRELLDHGLSGALQRYIAEFAANCGVKVKSDLAGATVELPLRVGAELFRMIQESLTNIGKHADARNVQITITATAEAMEVTIRDDGIGFDIEEVQRKATSGEHFGFASLRARASLLNGSIHIDSEPGVGTTVQILVPLPPSPTEDRQADNRS